MSETASTSHYDLPPPYVSRNTLTGEFIIQGDDVLAPVPRAPQLTPLDVGGSLPNFENYVLPAPIVDSPSHTTASGRYDYLSLENSD